MYLHNTYKFINTHKIKNKTRGKSYCIPAYIYHPTYCYHEAIARFFLCEMCEIYN